MFCYQFFFFLLELVKIKPTKTVLSRHKYIACVCAEGATREPCSLPNCFFGVLLKYKLLIPEPESKELRFVRALDFTKSKFIFAELGTQLYQEAFC